MATEAAISAVVQLLGDLLRQNSSFLQGIKDDVESLKDELNRMQAFLRYANKKQTQDERVSHWISEIRELAQDAQDTIEIFNLYVNSRKRKHGIMNHVSSLFNNYGIGEEIKSIRKRLVDIDSSRERYGINDQGESGEPSVRSEVEERRRLAPWLKDEHLVGMEDDVKKLLEPIMDQEKQGLSVVGIVGMGGIGKSTLAREVYNHSHIAYGRFDCRGWVVVSSEFAPHETIKQLILETCSTQEKQGWLDEIRKLEETMRDRSYLESTLKRMLYRQLEGKTYLIVLDDVWKKEDCDSLMTAFPNEQGKISRLLLTTRINVIAKQCQSFHELKLLDAEKSWELFLKKGLIGNREEEFPRELEQIGRNIVEKCKGLPLSITVMGGLLAEKRYSRDWEEALNELNSHLERTESNVSEILEGILELSYQNLSWELRCCFLCLAFFEEDATISVKRLLNIMVGQGFIQQRGRIAPEAIARANLDELINRNLVQVKDLTLDNRVKSCHLHDSLHSICLKKAKKEIGLEILMKTGCRISTLKKIRHVVQWDDLGSFSMDQKKSIRSLFLHNMREDIRQIEPSYWSSFPLLKTLDLHGRILCLQQLPESFKCLLGLKQLRTNFNFNYSPLKLPTWLDTLKNLELLDLKRQVVHFPDVELEMVSLRHICAYEVRAPMITNSWKNVETLKMISLEDWMKSSLRLTDDCHVRDLGIILDSSTVNASFENLKNLVQLHLVWDYGHTFDAAIIPHLRNLTKLKLSGVMRQCPSASMFPPNLSHLTLRISSLKQDPMQELGKLPKLVYLKMKDQPYMGERMQILHGGFPKLRVMSLQALNLLRRINIEEGGMPQLKLLRIAICPDLDTSNLSNQSYQLQILRSTT